MYKLLYVTGAHIPKRNLLGIWATIDRHALEAYALLIEAAFAHKYEKRTLLIKARTKCELIMRLTRTAHQLGIVAEKYYCEISLRLVSITKMVSGWIKYVEK